MPFICNIETRTCTDMGLFGTTLPSLNDSLKVCDNCFTVHILDLLALVPTAETSYVSDILQTADNGVFSLAGFRFHPQVSDM
jgi:hypothetical protein